MIIQKIFKCNKCKNKFTKSDSERFIKSQMPSCPVCGSPEIVLEKTKIVGKKPGS